MRRFWLAGLCVATVAVGPATRPAVDDAAVRERVATVMAAPAWNGRAAAVAAAQLRGAGPQLRRLLEPYWAAAATDPDRAAMAYLLYLHCTGQEPPHPDRLAAVGHFAVTVTGPRELSATAFRDALRKQLPVGSVAASRLGRTRQVPTALLAVDGVAKHRRLVNALGDSQAPGSPAVLVVAGDTLFTPGEYADFLRDRGKPSPADYAVAFRNLYDHLGDTYPEFQVKGIDWPAVGRELLPRAAAVANDHDDGLLVMELVARLKDTHAVVEDGTAAVPDPDLPRWDVGFACLDDDRGRPVVYAVQPGSPAARAGVHAGDAVVTVDGVAAGDAIADRMRQLSTFYGYSSDRTCRYDAVRSFADQPDRGAEVRLTLVTAAGHDYTADLTADCGPRYLPRLPVPRDGIDDSADCSSTRLADGIGYLYVRRIGRNLIANLDAAVRSLGPVRGLVIDVRGNSGGGFDAQAAFADFDPDEKRWPDRPRYLGPIALLVDGRTVSAGEGWSSWFVARRRARLFGTTSAGASCRKEEYTLTDGRFRVVVPVKPYTGFLDRPIEGQGLVPDEPVACTAADLAVGRDTVVGAAVRWLDAQAKR